MSTGTYQFQLDTFNYDTGEYECVEVRYNSDELKARAILFGLKCWRVWNRTTRAERDRMLPPMPRIVKTFNHDRRWSLVHCPTKKQPTTYKDFCRAPFDKCAQCDISLTSKTGRTDLLCEYHAEQ